MNTYQTDYEFLLFTIVVSTVLIVLLVKYAKPIDKIRDFIILLLFCIGSLSFDIYRQLYVKKLGRDYIFSYLTFKEVTDWEFDRYLLSLMYIGVIISITCIILFIKNRKYS
jgi:hypothetical protein